MKKILTLGRLFLFSPAKAAAACVEDRALYDALKLYGLTLFAAAIFQYWKPYDFPDVNAAVPMTSQGFVFWLKVMMWQPLLMAVLIAFCGALMHWMKEGWLPLKVVTSFLWTAIPAILMLCYLPKDSGQATYITKTQFRILFVIWSAPTVFFISRVPAKLWRPLAAFLLVMNVVELAAFVPEAIVTAMRWEAGYKAVVGLAGFWMLIGGALGLKALPPARPLPRTLLPLLFALVIQIEIVFVLFMLGWLPSATLKALMYG